ncbi:hypothetical protein SAMN00777080_2139 [Aquiflexum balticum DSM 16537]|uniref:SD-repeat containing protein B domain-containing protein n=1 Tax=Aquiflexum balticum DSM 16537 TaxID=758820 RepID=A0A1W2H449_9BACT|nr:SdrD B-like domain-containing protein [Aquiflexum balticum]SMD43544.1 hypothetical protein SAMN00777080_2139 [Aquiflexum balticum DSM 16537]
MKKSLNSSLLLFISILFLASCQFTNQEVVTEKIDAEFRKVNVEDFRAELPGYFTDQLGEFEKARINNYDVEFVGRNVEKIDGVTSTTFHYKVSGIGKSSDLEKFFLQVPSCAGIPTSWEPLQSSKLDSKGITWSLTIGKDESKSFSMTFLGDVPLGVIESSITRNGKREKCKIMGPCEGVTDICGSIFIDANADGIKQNSESGIPETEIFLRDKKTNKILGSVMTLEDGSFSFQVLEGEYNVETTDELLNLSYKSTTPSSVHFCTDETDGSCINFGFEIDSEKMTRELEEGIVEGTAECADFWVDQLKYCGTSKGDYTEAEILEFLKQIEKLLLNEPFQFGSRKIKTALEILEPTGKSDIELFLKELLTAELNVVSQRGALKDNNGDLILWDNYNQALLIHSEAIGCEELGICSENPNDRKSNITGKGSRTMNSRLVDTTNTLRAFNGTGGIRN